MIQKVNKIKYLLSGLFLVGAINGLVAQTILPAEKDPNILSDMRVFLKVLNNSGGKPVEELAPKDARMVLVNAQKSVSFNYNDIDEKQQKITQDGITVNIHVVKPKGVKTNIPVFMFFHGGGWVLGDYPTHKRLVRDLVVNSGAAAVFVDFTPSPEAQYPVAINQAYAATKWVALNGNKIGVDGSRLAVAGNSVGGNMAAVVTLMAKDKKGPKISFQLLLWPVTDATFTQPSYTSFAEGRFLTAPLMKWMWDQYTTNATERKNIYASPLQASIEQLKGLPPALVQVAENDILHDEGVAYGRKLDEAGVPTTITEFKGFIHDYGMLNPLAKIPAVQSSIQQAAIALKKGLAKK